ncbi:Rtdr1 protein [Tribonema minus]|uniref:Rtdr1 protein n=1 Tax=Tribonema minus TaxID=303371 RepID=A0A836CN86_9STRA|nr:Rtdr1 protein [Tribonema minus]
MSAALAAIYSHEAKENPSAKGSSTIVEAYGLGKCPKLVEQVQSEDPEVCQNALKALCEEFHNPASIASCARANVFTVLPAFTLSSSQVTRARSSRALALASRDYNGRNALLRVGFLTTVYPSLDDESPEVRANIYEALEGTSRMPAGTRALVHAGYPERLVAKARDETDALKPAVLDVLCNVVHCREGVEAALAASAVEALVELLGGPAAAAAAAAAGAAAAAACAVLRGAAAALRELCFSEIGKIVAIQCDGVARLAALLRCGDAGVHAAALGALMTITTVDAGKRAFLATGAVA